MTPPRQSKLQKILEAYKAAVIHEYRFPDDVGTRLSTLAAKNFDQYILDSFLELLGEDENKDPTHVTNQNKPYLRTQQIHRNQLRNQLRRAAEDKFK